MDDTFYDGHDELYHHAKFGEDRTTRAGCRCENVVFVFLFFCHAPSPERRAFEECIVRTRIALPFIGRFRRGWIVFFGRDCDLRHATQFSHSSLGGATIFAKSWTKNAKSPKIGGRVCAHHFVQIAEGLKKIYYSSLGPRLYMCTYINFFTHVAKQRLQQVSNFASVVQKRLGMYKFVRTKSHAGSKFSKIFLSSCIQDGLQLCTYVSVFLCGVRWRHNRAPNLEPRFLFNFVHV